MIDLVEALDGHFAWLMTGAAEFGGLVQPPGGAESSEVLTLLRGIAAAHRERGVCGMWLIVHGNEVVGSCGYMRAIADGAVEIGYGVTASRRGRGYGTQAVAALVQCAQRAGLSVVAASTAVENRASQILLERNGFVQVGTRTDPEDGTLINWQKTLKNDGGSGGDGTSPPAF